jgi:hypothetical protein
MKPRDEQDRDLEQLLRRYRPAAPAPELKPRILDVAGRELEKTVRQNSEIPWQKAYRPLWAAAAAIALIFFATNGLGTRLLPAPRPINLTHLSEDEANQRLQELAFELGIAFPGNESARQPHGMFLNRSDELDLEHELEPDSPKPSA